MTITSPPLTAAVAPGQTFWPAAEPVDFVPAQAGAGSRRPAPQGPMPSLRSLGVDAGALAVELPQDGRATVLRCASSALCAAQHLLEDAAPSPHTLAQVIESDPVLTLRVLHLANSNAQTGFHADTVPQAISALGAPVLASLIDELLLDASLGAMDGLWRVLARALTCEELAGDRIAFTAGLLSGLADELGVPRDVVVQVAGVSREVSDAVRFGSGPWGGVLLAVAAYEHRDAAGIARSGIPAIDVYDSYLRGATEAMATAQALGGR